LPIIIIIRYQIYFLLVFNSAYYYHGMTQGGTNGNTSCGRGHYRTLLSILLHLFCTMDRLTLTKETGASLLHNNRCRWLLLHSWSSFLLRWRRRSLSGMCWASTLSRSGTARLWHIEHWYEYILSYRDRYNINIFNKKKKTYCSWARHNYWYNK
jgi:hypothetical protein